MLKLNTLNDFEPNLWTRTFNTALNNLLKVPKEYADLQGGLEKGVLGCAAVADKAVELFRERSTHYDQTNH